MNILIADDSAVFRVGITETLKGCAGIEKIKSVNNGKVALEYLQKHGDVDVLILDMEMPVMNGMETLEQIKKLKINVHIIMCSAFTERGAKLTITALLKGADDFVPKALGGKSAQENINKIHQELYPKIIALTEKRSGKKVVDKHKKAGSKEAVLEVPVPIEDIFKDGIPKADIVLIGSSTGGPDVLNSIFSNVTQVGKIPILIAQHMPPMFTKHLVERLNKNGAIEFKEAEDGEELKRGMCYIAPGDFHMLVRPKKVPGMSGRTRTEYIIRLTQGERVQNVRPSVDVLFESVAECFPGKSLAIILTGMGSDGKDGAIQLKEKGHDLFYVQDEESSVTWGMPGSIISADLGAKVLKLDQFSILINEVMKKSLN